MRIEVADCEKCVLADSGFQSTACEKNIRNAGGRRILKKSVSDGFIVRFKRCAVNTAEDVVLIILPVFIRQPRRDVIQLPGEAALYGYVEFALQRGRN